MQDGPKIKILFEDNKLLVVEKPPGLLSQSDFTGRPDVLTQAKAYIKEKYNKPGNVFVGLMHRLDKEVGGVMVLARNSKAAKYVSEQIRNGQFKKTYLAEVENPDLPDQGSLVNYLVKDEKRNLVTVVDESTTGAKLAKLKYEVVSRTSKTAIVRIQLETGRSHQIRVQFANIGHPLVGDAKYGARIKPIEVNIRLWSSSIEIIHPGTRKKMMFISRG